MQVGFSDSQLELRAAVREVLAKECPPALVRQSLDDPEAWRPLWRTFVDLGWTALAHYDDELGVVELIAVMEELGSAAAPAPLLSSAGLAAGALRAAGPEARDWQDELAGGAVGALGVGRARDFAPTLHVNGGRVRGTVHGVADARRADLFVLAATTDDGDHVLAITRPGDSMEITSAESVDASRPVGHVVIDAEPEAVLPITWPQALSLPLTAAAAELVGLATRVLDIAVAHATAREQFERVIGSFQGVKHRLADCYVATERARSLTYAAAMRVADPDADPAETWRTAALAKAAANDAAVEGSRAGIQVHGALGMTWEHDLHLYLRRAWQSAMLLGDSPALYRAAASSFAGVG